MDFPKRINIIESKSRIKRAIRNIEEKMNDPSFLQELSNKGHIIASYFLESVRLDLNYIEMQVGRTHHDYIELSEAVAFIGSGCLRWATARTRTLLASSDFKRNKQLYLIEKNKVEKCSELIQVFSNMEMQDMTIKTTVFEVNDIITKLNSIFRKRSGCYIATVVYNNPNAQQVLVFKEYRDTVLEKSTFGHFVLSIYYILSPPLSKFIKNKPGINRLLEKTLLNPLYKKLSNNKLRR